MRRGLPAPRVSRPIFGTLGVSSLMSSRAPCNPLHGSKYRCAIADCGQPGFDIYHSVKPCGVSTSLVEGCRLPSRHRQCCPRDLWPACTSSLGLKLTVLMSLGYSFGRSGSKASWACLLWRRAGFVGDASTDFAGVEVLVCCVMSLRDRTIWLIRIW